MGRPRNGVPGSGTLTFVPAPSSGMGSQGSALNAASPAAGGLPLEMARHLGHQLDRLGPRPVLPAHSAGRGLGEGVSTAPQVTLEGGRGPRELGLSVGVGFPLTLAEDAAEGGVLARSGCRSKDAVDRASTADARSSQPWTEVQGQSTGGLGVRGGRLTRPQPLQPNGTVGGGVSRAVPPPASERGHRRGLSPRARRVAVIQTPRAHSAGVTGPGST